MKPADEVLYKAQEFVTRLESNEDNLDYKNKSHVIEVNNFLIRHSETIREDQEGIKLYATLLGFLCMGRSYHSMKTFTHKP